jgi:hypothetical protein
MTFGVSASFIRGTFWCVNRAGQRIKVVPRNRYAAEACLEEVRQRISR